MNNEVQHTESGNSPPTADLEQQIRQAILDSVNSRRAGVSYAVNAGNLLLKLKESVEHGQWLPALSRVGVSERTAQRYMWFAKNPPRVADFPSVRAAYKAYKEERLRQKEAEQREQEFEAATAKVGNPSIRPLPLDPCNDDEREVDAVVVEPTKKKLKKAAKKLTPADDLEEHLKAWSRAQFDFDEWQRVAREADEATEKALGLLKQILAAFPPYAPNRAGNAPAIEPLQLTHVYKEIEKHGKPLLELTSEIGSLSRGEFDGQYNLVYGGSFDTGLKRWANRIRKMQAKSIPEPPKPKGKRKAKAEPTPAVEPDPYAGDPFFTAVKS